MHSSHSSRPKGFSLVELSIVLVILGLLVGGVLSGQSLIHASELRATIEQVKKMDTAENAYKDKYFCIAGDCNNASSFGWASPTTGCTLNGDGSGRLDARCEIKNNMGILALAQMIQGTELAQGYGSGGGLTGAALRPKITSVGTDGYQAYWWTQYNSLLTNGSTPTGNYYWLTTMGSGGPTGINALTTYDSYAMDMKLDDGKPTTGGIRVSGANPVTVGLPGFTYQIPTFVPATDATAVASTTNPQCVSSTLDYNVLNTNNSVCSITIKTSY